MVATPLNDGRPILHPDRRIKHAFGSGIIISFEVRWQQCKAGPRRGIFSAPYHAITFHHPMPLRVWLPLQRLLHPFVRHVVQISSKQNPCRGVQQTRLVWIESIGVSKKCVSLAKVVPSYLSESRQTVGTLVVWSKFKSFPKRF